MLLTGVGQLEAEVRARAVGVELQPQVVGGAVEEEPQQLIPREGSQRARRAVFSIIHLTKIHSVSHSPP